MPSVAALIPAGGSGARLGSATPKQFLRVGGSPILAVTVAHFTRHPAVTAVVVAAPAAHVARARALVSRGGRAARVQVVEGGATRHESVWRAMQAAPVDAEILVVHDAVRPFVTRALLDAVLSAAAEHGAAVCGLPIAETVKRVRDEIIEGTVDRTGLWAVQTPQAFRAALLREAHEKARRDGVDGTDDAMLVERLGHRVRMVRGLPANVKITTPEDLRWARSRR